MSKADANNENFRSQLIDQLSDYLKNEPSFQQGADDSDTQINREIDLSVKSFMDERQVRIRLALQRIEDGSYGTCEDCGGSIGFERLEAIPEATHCIDCQKSKERRLHSIPDVEEDTLFPDQAA